MNKKPWTQTKHLALTLTLSVTLFLLWLLAGFALRLPVAHAADLTVCLSGSCDYTSIQDAVDAATPGDIIKVAAGTYTGVNGYGGTSQAVYISKTLTIRGGYTITNAFADPPDPVANPTTVDAQSLGRAMVITGTTTIATVENLRLTGGSATAGGGIFNDGTLTLIHSTVSDNLARGTDGADSSSLTGGGEGGFGGGIYNAGALTIIDSTLSGNQAIGGTGGNSVPAGYGGGGGGGAGMGGGIFNDTAAAINVTNSTFSSNVARGGTGGVGTNGGGAGGGFGGGIFNREGIATISNCTLSGNQANGGTGGDLTGGGGDGSGGAGGFGQGGEGARFGGAG